MSALGDALEARGREFLLGCTTTITVDSLSAAVTPTFSIRFEAPGYSLEALTAQTSEEVTAAIAELQDYVTAKW
jgi:hypothetical protein